MKIVINQGIDGVKSEKSYSDIAAIGRKDCGF
jgi:hypothetical protein